MFDVNGPENRIPVCGVLKMEPLDLQAMVVRWGGHQGLLADMDIARAMLYAGAVLCAVT